MTKYSYERLIKQLPTPTIIEVGQNLAIGQVIDDLLLFALASLETEWENQVIYLPLR